MSTCKRLHCSAPAKPDASYCHYDSLFSSLKTKIRRCKDPVKKAQLKAQREEMKHVGKHQYNLQRHPGRCAQDVEFKKGVEVSHGVTVEEEHTVRETKSVSQSHTDRKMMESIEKVVERKIEENEDGSKTTFEQERSQTIRQTQEEILETKRTHSLEHTIKRKVKFWKNQFHSLEARKYLHDEFKYRKGVRSLRDVGFYKYKDLPLAEALVSFEEDWNSLNTGMATYCPIDPGKLTTDPFKMLGVLRDRVCYVRYHFNHLTPLFEYVYDCVKNAYKNFLADEKKIRKQCTGNFRPKMVALCDPAKFSDEYITTVYQAQWKAHANLVTTGLYTVGIHGNSPGFKQAFKEKMQGMAHWEEIKNARANLAKRGPHYRSPRSMRKHKLTFGFSPKQLFALNDNPLPCLVDRVATCVDFQEGKYVKTKALVSTIHSFRRILDHGSQYGGRVPPEMKSWEVLGVEEMQNVGFASDLFVHNFCAEPREWTESTRFGEGMTAWAVLRVAPNDEPADEFVLTLPGCYVTHIVPEAKRAPYLKMLDAPITCAVKKMLCGTEYDSKVIYDMIGSKGLAMGASMLNEPEFAWAKNSAAALEKKLGETSRREYYEMKTEEQLEVETRVKRDSQKKLVKERIDFLKAKEITLAKLRKCTL
jgi:hypothetical protein